MNQTGIQYLDLTWNPTTGCTFGCPECWARDVAQNRLAPAWEQKAIKSGAVIVGGPDFEKFSAYKTFTPTLHPERLDQPAKRKKPAVIGVCFMGDLFDPALSDGARMEVHASMLAGNQHTYILLTKQPERMGDYYELQGPDCEGELIPNIYLGFSARNQAEFDAGWPHMDKLAAAGWKVWVSLEPMQGHVDLFSAIGSRFSTGKGYEIRGDIYFDRPRLSAVILGAQSGKNAVPLNTDWARSVRNQCAAAKISFMFKQDNSTGKVISLPELDGVQHTALAWSQS